MNWTALVELFETSFMPAPHKLGADVASYGLATANLRLLSGDDVLAMLPSELRRAAPRRMETYWAGRLCAYRAMRDLGLMADIPRGTQGEPVWPSTLSGSITHTDMVAYAAVCPRRKSFGIGIDTERYPTNEVVQVVRDGVLTDDERRLLQRSHHDATLLCTVIFSAKEAVYKAIFPKLRRFVDFTEIEAVDLDLDTGCISMRPTRTSRLRPEDVPNSAYFHSDRRGMVHCSVDPNLKE